MRRQRRQQMQARHEGMARHESRGSAFMPCIFVIICLSTMEACTASLFAPLFLTATRCTNSKKSTCCRR